MPELESLIEEFMAFWWRVHPTAATIAGVHLHDAALEAYDPDSITERRGRLEGYLELFDRAAPPGQTREVEVEVIRALIRCELYRLTELRPYRTDPTDRKSTRLNYSHVDISYAVICILQIITDN